MMARTAARSYRITSAARRRRRASGSLAVRAGVYGRDSRYRVPDARCRYGYRLTPAGERARLRLKTFLCTWFLFLAAGAIAFAAHRPELGVLIPLLGTILLAFYARHRYAVNHRPAAVRAAGVIAGAAGEVRERKPVSRDVKAAVWQRDGGRCRHCGINDADAVAATGVHLCYDHIVPFSRNGADTVGNIQLLCEPCNLAKSNKYTG